MAASPFCCLVLRVAMLLLALGLAPTVICQETNTTTQTTSSSSTTTSAENTTSSTTTGTTTWTATSTATTSTISTVTSTTSTDTTTTRTTSTSTTITVTTVTSTTVTTTTATTSTVTNSVIVGYLNDVLCTTDVVDVALYGHPSDIKREILLGALVDCSAYSRGLLQLVLEWRRPEVALHLAEAYIPMSWQFFVRNGTNATVLLMACDLGYAALVDELVRVKNIDPLVEDINGNNALHIAANWPDTAAKLLEVAPNVTGLQLATNQAGDQPLHVALKANVTGSATAMLSGALSREGSAHAAQVATTADANGDRPVHLTGDAGVLRLLGDLGASLNVQDTRGATPLHRAAEVAGTAENGALALLAAASAGLNVQDAAGLTPLHYAARSGVLENCNWLIGQGASTQVLDANGRLPLSLGLLFQQTHIVSAFGVGEKPPLNAVVLVGSLELLQLVVLNQSVPVATPDQNTGRSAVFLAAELGRNDMVDFMLAHGADVNTLDASGLSLLAATILARQETTLQLLLNRSADVALSLQNRSTALHLAAAVGALPEANLLLAAGAGVDATDAEGQTPMHVVATAALAERLLQYGATPVRTTSGLQPLHTASLAARQDVMEVVLRWRHGSVDATTLAGNTPLHLAAASGSERAVALLLRWCADTQARNAAGRLPHQLSFDANTSRAIADSTLQPGRCECDCGPLILGPLLLSSQWRGGCEATMRCQIDSLSSASQQIRCSPQAVQEDGNGVSSAWTPARPTLSCGSATVSAAWRPGQLRVLSWLVLLASSTLA